MTQDEIDVPRWPVVMFGNGVQAIAKRIKPNITEESGIVVAEFHLAPTPEMMDYYNFKRGEDLNNEGLIVMRYPQIEVMVPETKKRNALKRIFILSDFEGNKTVMTELFPDTKMIQRYQVENKLLMAKMAALEDDIKLIMIRPGEYIKKTVEVIKTARQAAGDTVPQMYSSGGSPGYSQGGGGFEND
jgi:hypothetical protein